METPIEQPIKACPWCDSALIRQRKDPAKPKERQWYCYKCAKPLTKPIERSLKGGGRRKPTEDIEVLSEEETLTRIAQYNPTRIPENPYPHIDRDRAYASFLNLAGPRISEVAGSEGEVSIPGLQLKHIEWISDDQVEVTLPVLKARKRKNRKVPMIKNSTKYARFFFEYLEKFGKPDYSNPISLEKWKNTPLFPFKRSRGHQIIVKMFGQGFYPHFMRHQCVSQLVTKFDMSDTQAVKYMGWANNQQMTKYAHLRTEELASKIRTKIKN